jgi:hypothetical protein
LTSKWDTYIGLQHPTNVMKTQTNSYIKSLLHVKPPSYVRYREKKEQRGPSHKSGHYEIKQIIHDPLECLDHILGV